jgi:hypothetical protein
MKLTLTHHGRSYTISKHPAILTALKRGAITEAEAAQKSWHLRLTVDGKDKWFKLVARLKDKVLGEARDFLSTREKQPNEFLAYVAAKAARRGLTVGQLAQEWFTAHCAFDDAEQRKPAAAAVLQATLQRALPYWENKSAAAIEAREHALYVAWRRQHKERGTGSRSADLELAALSCLFDWARLTSRVAANPFAKRKRFHKAEDVRHCHEFAPKSDEDVHAILNWLWSNPNDHQTIIAGAWLCFTGLTGLRPEEPAELLRSGRLDAMPTDTKSLPPGTIFPMRDGTLKMRVKRSKHGQNPFVTIHPAALEFLTRWTDWLRRNLGEAAGQGGVSKYFPGITADDTSLLNRRLAAACRALNLGEIKPKGFGRAYYVRCRRSAGIEDAQISMELGQTTNGKLIRDTYGDPDDLFASGLFDWLPATGEPAWQSSLRHIPIVLPGENNSARYENDTPATAKDTGKMPEDSRAENREIAPDQTTAATPRHQCSPLENENPLVKQGD